MHTMHTTPPLHSLLLRFAWLEFTKLLAEPPELTKHMPPTLGLSETPLSNCATKNLLEDTDGLRRPPF